MKVEHKKYGKDFRYYDEESRKFLFSRWNDELHPGVLFRLLNFGEQTYSEIALSIGWHYGSVRDEIRRILTTRAGKSGHLIKKKYGTKVTWQISHQYKSMSLETYLDIIYNENWDLFDVGYVPKKQKTDLEEMLTNFLDEKFPGDFTYTGKHFMKGTRLKPDFTHRNQNKIIEMNGLTWHIKTSDPNVFDPKINEKERIEAFKKHNIDALVIWDKEIENTNIDSQRSLELRIKNFLG